MRTCRSPAAVQADNVITQDGLDVFPSGSPPRLKRRKVRHEMSNPRADPPTPQESVPGLSSIPVQTISAKRFTCPKGQESRPAPSPLIRVGLTQIRPVSER